MGYKGHSYIYQIEMGQCKPSEDFLKKLEVVLDLSPEEVEKLQSLAPKDHDDHLTPARKRLKKLLRDTAGGVGSFSGEFDEEDIEMLIEVIEKWKEKVRI